MTTAISTAPVPATASPRPAHRARPTRAAARRRQVLRAALNPTVVLGIVAPFAVYELLSGRTSMVTALAVGAVFPAAATLWTLIRSRRLDPIAVMTLAGIVLGLAGALIFDSPMFLLLKESVVTGAFGLVFLGSLLAARPFTFSLARTMVSSGPEARAALDASWDVPAVRSGHRRITVMWGAALVGDAALRAALAVVLTPGALLFVSPFLSAAVIGPVAIVTLRMRRRAIAAQRESTQQESVQQPA